MGNNHYTIWGYMKEIIFNCFTPYQLLISMYYANSIKGVKKVLIFKDFADYHIDPLFYQSFFDVNIYVPYYYKKNIFLKQFYKMFYSGYLFRFSPIYHQIIKIKSAIFMFFSDQEVTTNKIISILKKNKSNKLILVEEGLALYTISYTRISLKTLLGNILCGVCTQNYFGESKSFDTVFAIEPNCVHKRFMCKKVIKQSDIFLDTDFLKKLRIQSDFIRGGNRKKLLILGDPVNELGIDEVEYVNSIIGIVNNCKDDYDIYIKPHPRENVNIYKCIKNCTIINDYKWLPVELIATKYSFDALISIISSASINIARIDSRIKAFMTFKIYRFNLQDEIVDRMKMYKNIVIVDSFNDLFIDLHSEMINFGSCCLNNKEDVKYLNSLISSSD